MTKLLFYSYIKELADRINSIEGKLGGKAVTADLLGLSGATPRDLADAYSPAVSLNENAKRPFSSLSVDAFSTPASNRQAPWASEPRPIHPYQAPELQRSPYTPNALAPQPIAGRTEGLASLKPAPPEADRPLAEVPGYQLQEEIDDTAFQRSVRKEPTPGRNQVLTQIFQLSRCRASGPAPARYQQVQIARIACTMPRHTRRSLQVSPAGTGTVLSASATIAESKCTPRQQQTC